MKKYLKWIAACMAIVMFLAAGYLAYVYLTYHRIEDYQKQKVEVPGKEPREKELRLGKEYTATTYNIGFGAYLPDFSFFMDGGKSSRAKSEDSVVGAVTGVGQYLKNQSPDFALMEEVDLDGTRSHHVNQYEILKKHLPEYYSTFGINYNSAFLMYPITQPHGKNKSGLALFSKYPIQDSIRRSLPISTSFSKFFDLDRCYTVSRISVENGKELVIFTVHLSAYEHDEHIRSGQIGMLTENMKEEYEKGNYVLCGGDFNRDLKAKEGGGENVESWAYPFPRADLPEHFSLCMDGLQEEEKQNLWNSARNADTEFVEGKTFTVTLDGFIISDNMECTAYDNIKTGFLYSDHDPVLTKFVLK